MYYLYELERFISTDHGDYYLVPLFTLSVIENTGLRIVTCSGNSN
jgi:hypothetical protein